eukprot:CAMPEP_0175142442 /NCGR_PEP_ID=MMETSP0087-20121206/12807_1 /TAXON_ID=136419 /ORGANISM="Unknown Unknown, Strain D1" /LENGTH=689 /DNA_ID=CAMNT_0016426257 /DNA_START=56 /DNA_END=2125 /DNA_ORIENTATION=-
MPIDILNFREEKGGDLKAVRELQDKRFKPQADIDAIIEIDQEWRKLQFQVDNLKAESTKLSKAIGQKIKAKEDPSELTAQVKAIKLQIAETENKCKEAEAARDRKLRTIGNYVHESVPVSQDEENNLVVSTHGQCRPNDGTLYHHHELLHMIDGYGSEQGVTVAGHRGYFLKGVGVLLNQALINYGIGFLYSKNYTPLQPPFFMKKEIMAETAQLEQFDEELYKVSGDGNENYLIATSEQPISAYHRGDWLEDSQLPIKYAGYSTCFRKEAGSHGRDTWGIFRIHQFEKVEQFVLTAPDKSWEMQEEMIATAQAFYKGLGLSFRVVNIVSGELNNAAARKLDLEAWFPTLGVYRELVSCSNCTDYQSRAMGTRYGQKKMGQKEKQYVHMLNATLTATERTICCLLENYQTKDGVLVPEVLQPYMMGMKIMPFVKPPPENKNAKKQEQAAAKKEKKNAGAKKQEKKEQPKKEQKKGQPKKEQQKEQPKKEQKKEQSKKAKGGKKEVDPAVAKKLKDKLHAKVDKEGGKKAQDIAGLRDMGGVAYFHVAMENCEGDFELLNIAMEAMNRPCPEDAEERRGGADEIGKVLLSYNDARLAFIMNVPKCLHEKCSIKDWFAAFTEGFDVVMEGKSSSEYMAGYIKQDQEKGIFPMKIRDDMINKGFAFLKAKQLVLDDDDDEDEMVFGDDDFMM